MRENQNMFFPNELFPDILLKLHKTRKTEYFHISPEKAGVALTPEEQPSENTGSCPTT